LISPLANLGYRKISMNVKIAMLVPASEYERLTLEVASSSMESLLGRVISRSSSPGRPMTEAVTSSVADPLVG
jgi:hypothetical protein